MGPLLGWCGPVFDDKDVRTAFVGGDGPGVLRQCSRKRSTNVENTAGVDGEVSNHDHLIGNPVTFNRLERSCRRERENKRILGSYGRVAVRAEEHLALCDARHMDDSAAGDNDVGDDFIPQASTGDHPLEVAVCPVQLRHEDFGCADIECGSSKIGFALEISSHNHVTVAVNGRSGGVAVVI